MKSDLNKQIGARLRHFRINAGYTQAKLAELVGCETSTIGRCEIGKDRISLTLLAKIADVMQVELYKFFIDREPDGSEKTVKSITKLLNSASRTQLGLIYSTISNIIDLTDVQE